MEEKTLLKVALICSVIGIFIILIFADRLELSPMGISGISESLVDQSVKIQGKISAVRNTPSVLTLDIKDDSGSIKVVVFNDQDSELSEGDLVEVTGKVKEYKGSIEIEANKVVMI